MFSKTYGAAILGIDAILVQVEADVSDGLPGLELVGFLASEVREARERVRVAIHNTGITLPPKKITVNLSPADVRKEGTAFDLPIAIAILTASGHLSQEYLSHTLFAGELSLDGKLNPVNGIIPIACCARRAGFHQLIVPKENEEEGEITGQLEVHGCRDLSEVLRLLLGEPPKKLQEEQASAEKEKGRPPAEEKEEYFQIIQTAEQNHCLKPKQELAQGQADLSEISLKEEEMLDFSDISGQTAAKRAIEIAVAGGHNILFTGSPGSGKTMLARRIPTIMPELSLEESLELSKIYSICGKLRNQKGLIRRRPFCAPHHTITINAMAGGGKNPRPGLISLASHGVLFLDEFAEFERQTIELLRQPLEERQITVDRVAGSVDYPASFLLVAAMNPCPCGAYPNRSVCRCTEPQIHKYQSRISRPVMDRIDLFLQVMPVSYEELNSSGDRETSAQIRVRILRARERQKERYKGLAIQTNAELSARQLQQFCHLTRPQEELLRAAYHRYQLSARAYHRIIKVARTIADLEGVEEISEANLCEAIGYRKF